MRVSRPLSVHLAGMLAIALGAQAVAGEVADPQILVETRDLESPDTGACFPVDLIVIGGEFIIPHDVIAGAVAEHATQCIGTQAAGAIVGAINAAHAEAGFITTQGYLPEQDIRASRALTIEIIPGRVEAIDYRESAGLAGEPLRERFRKSVENIQNAESLWQFTQAFSDLFQRLDDPLDRFQIIDGARHPGVKPALSFDLAEGDVLHLERLQQGIERINSVPSGRARASLEPGEAPATSRVVIENQPEDTFRVTVGYERNAAELSGSGRTVSERIRLDVAKDNLIGLNDAWRASLASGVNSNEASLGLTLPYRRVQFAFNGAYSESYQQITPLAGLFSQSGIVSARVDYLLSRDAGQQTRIDASFTWRVGERHINDLKLTPQRFAVARIGGSRTLFPGERRQISFGAGINRGLTWFGATRDPQRPAPDTPRAQFWKIDGFAAYAHGFQRLGVWRSELTGQWSPTPLYSDDQATIGSGASVRGFAGSLAKVDTGAVWRNTFQFSIPPDVFLGERAEEGGFLVDVISATQPYLFVDAGYGRELASQRTVARAGAGLGLRYAHGRTTIDASVAYPLHDGGRRLSRTPDISFALSFKLF
jgi:hemolysin activation/secretion protein